MQSVFKHILNPDIHLRRRLFQLLSTIALAEFILVLLYTVLSGGGAGHITVMAIGAALFAVTVAATFRTGRMRPGTVLSGLLYFSIYPLTFFPSGGMYGGAPVVFAFALVYVFLVTQKWERVLALALCVAASGACYVISYLHPERLTRHTVIFEHAESFLSIILVLLLLCALFAFVTEVYQAENRIVQKQKKEIEELNRAQKRFFSSMSHEIRTPVNAIIGLNEMTLRENLSPEILENARNIEAASKILLHTINEILDMAKLETGGMEILCADYRPTDMLSDIVNMVWFRAQQKGLDFQVRVDPDVPALLRGDETRVKQILLNLATNAVKYTRKGFVTLAISGRREGAGIRMLYDVIDTGIGIRPENIPALFTAFQRVDAQKTHAIEGTGLGLSIVRELLDRMGGDVTVTSEYGKGSTFHVEIPQEIADPTPIGPVSLKKPHTTAQAACQSSFTAPSARILAVDDTPMNLTVLKKLLRETKATVDTAASGAEALQMTAQTHYDVILMDHQMPEMDGIECLRRIREQPDGQCRDSKIVCLTANVGTGMEKFFLDSGFDGYLEKPIRGKTLEEALAGLLILKS